jgi:hypothetical protein
MVQPELDNTIQLGRIMKAQHIFWIALFSVATFLANAQDVLPSLLDNTIQQLPERARNLESIVEMRSTSLSRIDSFSKLEKVVASSWKQDLPNISVFAENEAGKTLYFKAAQALPRHDYIQFMTTATLLAADHSISVQQFKWGLFPGAKHLREMWIENPADEALIELARQARPLFTDDEATKSFCDKVISGSIINDNIGKDEKSLSEAPTVSQKPSAEVQRPNRRLSESPEAGMTMPNERTHDSSVVGSLMQRIDKGGSLTFVGIIGIIIAAILIWRWKSKSTP